MIFDGYWKWELEKLFRSISIWCKLPIFNGLTEHRLNRAVLYSAIILRKCLEDEMEAEKVSKEDAIVLPKFPLLNAKLQATCFPYVDDDGWFFRGKICTSDYGKGEAVTLSLQFICNQLVHSYAWGVARSTRNKRFAGFLVASDRDKEKHVHFVSFEEWCKMLKFCIQQGAF